MWLWLGEQQTNKYFNLLVKKMVVYFDLAKSFECIWHKHHWNVDMSKLSDLKLGLKQMKKQVKSCNKMKQNTDGHLS